MLCFCFIKFLLPLYCYFNALRYYLRRDIVLDLKHHLQRRGLLSGKGSGVFLARSCCLSFGCLACLAVCLPCVSLFLFVCWLVCLVVCFVCLLLCLVTFVCLIVWLVVLSGSKQVLKPLTKISFVVFDLLPLVCLFVCLLVCVFCLLVFFFCLVDHLSNQPSKHQSTNQPTNTHFIMQLLLFSSCGGLMSQKLCGLRY